MNVEIIDKELKLEIYGCSGVAVNKNYTDTGFRLMDKMWQIVKANHIKNKGMNIWVYESAEKMFAGIELLDAAEPGGELEHKSIVLAKYAYYKHIGPYSLIKQAGIHMQNELRDKGLVAVWPYLEIYGHWTNDETKLETELLMALGQVCPS